MFESLVETKGIDEGWHNSRLVGVAEQSPLYGCDRDLH